ncbi:MAG TPA: hypothetical protein VIU12_17035 [Chryseolinea sp.]
MTRLCLLLPLFFLGCTKKEAYYNQLALVNGQLMVLITTIPIDQSDTENGRISIRSKSGNLVEVGRFDEGFKVGKWRYYPVGSRKEEFDWAVYRDTVKHIAINYPSDWEVKTGDNAKQLFYATFEPRSPFTHDKLFGVLAQNKDAGVTLEDYWLYYCSVAFKEDVQEYASYKIKTESGKEFYLVRFIIKRNGEEVLQFGFVGEMDGKFYEILYSSLNEEYKRKHILFFDAIRSMTVGDARFFSPLEPIKFITPLKRPNFEGKPDPDLS